MPVYICQGRFTRDAIRGMIATPEDREKAVAELFNLTGGKLLRWYMTFGDYDFLVIAEVPDTTAAAAAVITAAAGGGVTDLKTSMGMTSAEAMKAFQAAGGLAGSFRSAGQSA